MVLVKKNKHLLYMLEKKISFSSSYENVASVCKSIRAFCDTNKVSETDSNGIEICLNEALNNVIKHAYKEQPGFIIDVIAQREGNWLNLIIYDSGKPRENLSKAKLEYDINDVESLPEGGMGLYIIENLMDSIDYQIVGITNIFIMKKQIV